MIEKYRKITIKTLIFITLLFSLFFADSWILPQKTIKDEIISYSKIFVNNNNKFSRNKILIGYIFFTQKGNEFSTQETFIEENEITIKHSYILKNITTVKSRTKDYSEKLMSGLNGACLYFTVSITISAIISLLFLRFDKNLSENGFQNIILFNSFLTFITICLYVIYN